MTGVKTRRPLWIKRFGGLQVFTHATAEVFIDTGYAQNEGMKVSYTEVLGGRIPNRRQTKTPLY
jgi:hypothetical protein